MKFLQFNKLLILSFIIICVRGHNFVAEKDVLFLLRVKNRPFKDEEVFKQRSRSMVENSAFDSSKNTTFVIHGYFENRKAEHYLRLSK